MPELARHTHTHTNTCGMSRACDAPPSFPRHSYVCFLEDDPLVRLTGCWNNVYETKRFSNVVCVLEGSLLEERLMALADTAVHTA